MIKYLFKSCGFFINIKVSEFYSFEMDKMELE